MVCILGMGDCKSKSESSLQVDLSTSISALQSVVHKNSQTSLASQTNINNFKLVVGGSIINSRLKTGQRINGKTQSSTEITGTTKQQMISELQSSVAAAVSQASKTQVGFLATGQGESKNKTDLKNAVSQSLTSTTLNENIQEAIVNSVNINDSTIVIGGNVVGSDLKFDQDIVATAIAMNVINSVVENINENLTKSGNDLQITRTADTKAAGIDEITKQLFEFLAAYKFIVLASVIACCLCVFVLVGGIAFLGQTPAGQEAISTGASVAAARAGKF